MLFPNFGPFQENECFCNSSLEYFTLKIKQNKNKTKTKNTKHKWNNPQSAYP